MDFVYIVLCMRRHIDIKQLCKTVLACVMYRQIEPTNQKLQDLRKKAISQKVSLLTCQTVSSNTASYEL